MTEQNPGDAGNDPSPAGTVIPTKDTPFTPTPGDAGNDPSIAGQAIDQPAAAPEEQN